MSSLSTVISHTLQNPTFWRLRDSEICRLGLRVGSAEIEAVVIFIHFYGPAM